MSHSAHPVSTLVCLLVEDNPADVAIVQTLIEQITSVHIDVEEAGSLNDAINAIGRRYPDVILLDLSLPDSAGLDTFISLHVRAPLTPIVVLSGLDEPDTVLDAVRLGAQDFLVKGRLSADTLVRSLQFAVARQLLVQRIREPHADDTIDRIAHSDTEALPHPEPLTPDLPALPLDRHLKQPLTARVPNTGRTAQTTSVFSLAGGLGSGGSADVVLAHQVNLDRDVAVKFLRANISDQHHRELFMAEARVTAWLEHPNIVPVYDLGDNFFVMRRVHGSTLSNLLTMRKNPQDGLAYFAEILLKVCDAVAFAHNHGVIHRDIKPDNIMVGDFGQVLLLDWGLALTIDAPADGRLRAPAIPTNRRHLCSGTLSFLAPEIASADPERVGYATDVWLLGATLYAVLTGHAPFDSTDHQICLYQASLANYPPVLSRMPKAPDELIALQCRAMSLDPKARGTVREFADDLRGWLTSGKSGG